MASGSQDRIAELHEALAETLLLMVKSGDASAGVLNVARQFVKDNGVTAVDDAPESPLTQLIDELPDVQTIDFVPAPREKLPDGR